MNDYNFENIPNLYSDRLVLRPLTIGDATEIQLLRSDERVNQFIEGRKIIDMDESEEFIEVINELTSKNKCVYRAVAYIHDDRMIGTICLWNFDFKKKEAELGYELLPEFHGKGIMSEAVQRLLKFGFESLLLRSIIAFTYVENEKSISLLKKNNFRKDTPDRPGDEKNKNRMIQFSLKKDYY